MLMIVSYCFVFECNGGHRDLHVLTHSFPTRRSSDLECDLIVFATGFDAGRGGLIDMNITGRDGLSLSQAWHNGLRAYLGMAVSGFPNRSEEHTSELQSLMRISYAVFCLKKKIRT